jgi:hypothetical protein
MSLWEKIPPLVGLVPPWDQMLQNVTMGKNPTACGTGPTVGPNVTKCHYGKKSHRWWDWSHRGTKCYKMSLWEKIQLFMPARHTGTADAARLALQPQQPQYISANLPKLRKLPTSAWSRRSRQQHSRQQRPCNFCLRPHHIQVPSPLAQASVRSFLTLQKERTRKPLVLMGLATSTTARLSSGSE